MVGVFRLDWYTIWPFGEISMRVLPTNLAKLNRQTAQTALSKIKSSIDKIFVGQSERLDEICEVVLQTDLIKTKLSVRFQVYINFDFHYLKICQIEKI